MQTNNWYNHIWLIYSSVVYYSHLLGVCIYTHGGLNYTSQKSIKILSASEHQVHISVFHCLCFTDLFIHVKAELKKGRDRERDKGLPFSFSLSKTCSSWCWAKLKSGLRNSVQVSHVGSKTNCLRCHLLCLWEYLLATSWDSAPNTRI